MNNLQPYVVSEIAEFQALGPGTRIVLNETIIEDSEAPGWTNPHWKNGPAFVTFHTYGLQVHRSRSDAERWNAQQAEIRPYR